MTKFCIVAPNIFVGQYGTFFVSPVWRLEFCDGVWIFGKIFLLLVLSIMVVVDYYNNNNYYYYYNRVSGL